MKGYKIFNPDWTCRGFKYKVGKTYEINEPPILCERGFHFCDNIESLFNYYLYHPKNKVAEVEILGDIAKPHYNGFETRTSSDKYHKLCTNKIKIVREIPWLEIYEESDFLSSRGHNIGEGNTGNFNNGPMNCGNGNNGTANSGDDNFGSLNTGDQNVGNYNSGDHNLGDHNTGDLNFGDYNVGSYNYGSHNNDNYNVGSRNIGYSNIGDSNCGNNNIGDENYGDFNICNRNCGCFNTKESNPGELRMFNKPAKMDDYYVWAHSLINIHLTAMLHPTKWEDGFIPDSKYTNPQEVLCNGGRLIMLGSITTAKMYLSGNMEIIKKMSNKKGIKESAMSLPNFDKEIFRQCTGIDIDKL